MTAQPALSAEPSPLHDDAALRDVQFIGAANGYAVGDHGTVWKTTDGGVNWTFVPTPTQASLRSASFLTDQVGFVAGVEWLPFARLSMGVLLKTVDGGQTWQRLGEGVLPGLEYVRFFDLDEGVVVGCATPAGPSGVWTTRDGGATWTAIGGPESRGWRAARFLAPDLGIVAGAEGRLSLVGGEQLLPARLPALGHRTVRDVTINSAAVGWLVGEGGLLLSSSTGGVSWQTPAGLLPESVPTIFDFHCVEQRGSQVWLAGAPGTIIWHSADQGTTWTSHSTGHTTPIYRLRFASDHHGVAVGALGSILATRDAGRTWQAVRGGQRRAAVLVVPSRTRTFAPELLAPLCLEQGYRTVLHLPVSTAALEGFDSRDEAAEVLQTTMHHLGGHAAQIGRQLAVDVPGLDRNAEQLHAHWQAQSERPVAQTLVGALVRELRMWRPNVVVMEEPTSHDVYGDWLRQAVLKAVEQASDATRELDLLDVANLGPWKVDRVFVQLPAGSHSDITFDLQALLPRTGKSAQLCAAPARSLWEPPLLPRVTLSFRCVDPNGGWPKSGDLLAGLNIPPGSAARRLLGTLAERDLEAAQRRLQRTRNLAAIADTTQSGSSRAAQLVAQWPEVANDWPHEQAAELLAEAAQRFRREAQFEHAEAIYLELVRRYPQQPAALDGLRWLLQYWTSAEVAWQRQRSRGVVQTQWTTDGVGTARRVEQALSTGSDFLAAPRSISDVLQARAAKTVDRTLANRQPIDAAAVPDSIDSWRQRAAELAQQLERQSPALFQQPEIQLPLAALKRARGTAAQADAIYRRFQRAAPEDAVRQLVERELWLAVATPEVPRKIISCKFTTSRPYLDGLLSDPCWQQAEELRLGVGGDEPPRSPPQSTRQTAGLADSFDSAPQGLLLFACDAEFLYVAASIPRHPQALPDRPQREGRTHDADLSRHDWLGMALDIDRDYATWYELRVDQRGWTSDRCWEDDGWDPQWYVAAEADEARWRVELAIPWTELSPRPPQVHEAWGLSLVRTVPAVTQYGWDSAPQWPPRWDSFGLLKFEAAPR